MLGVFTRQLLQRYRGCCQRWMIEEQIYIIYLQEPEPDAELKRDVIVSGCTLARYPLDDVSLV